MRNTLLGLTLLTGYAVAVTAWHYRRGRRLTGSRRFRPAYRAGVAQFSQLTGWPKRLALLAMGLAFTLGGGLLAQPLAGERLDAYWLHAVLLGLVWTSLMVLVVRHRGRQRRR